MKSPPFRNENCSKFLNNLKKLLSESCMDTRRGKAPLNSNAILTWAGMYTQANLVWAKVLRIIKTQVQKLPLQNKKRKVFTMSNLIGVYR